MLPISIVFNDMISLFLQNIRPKKDDDDADDDFEDDPFEALFSLLEEDLKNDDSVVDDDEINEEDIDKLASELEVVLGDFDMEMSNTDTADTESDNDDAQEVVVAEEVQEEDVQDKEDDDDEEEEKQVRLKNWQLKKLAYALKIGRRKTNVSVSI